MLEAEEDQHNQILNQNTTKIDKNSRIAPISVTTD